MLASSHTNGHANGGAPPPPEPVTTSWLGLVRRRWPWGVAVFALVLAATAGVLVVRPPIHRAEARLRLGEAPPSTGVSPAAGGGALGLLRLGGDAFANDLQLLGSRTVAEALVEEHALHVRLAAPRGWHRDSLLVSLAASRQAPRAQYEAAWTDEGRVQVLRTSPGDSAIGVFAPGEPAVFGGVTAVFRPRSTGAPGRFRVSVIEFGDAVRSTRSRLEFQRASREAHVLDLHFDDPDPGIAQAVVASAVARFVSLRTALNQRESGETVDSLRVVSGLAMAELREAEERLESLQRETRLVAAEAQGEALVERYSDALARHDGALIELEAVTSALARVEAAENPGQAWVSLVAHPRFLDNQTVGELLDRLTELEQQRIQLATLRTAQNVTLDNVLRQIELLDGSLRSLAEDYRRGLEEQVAVLGARVSEMEALLSRTPSLFLELARRQRDVRLLSEVVMLTEQRLRQEELRQALTFANVQVIDPAALRSRPVWPRKRMVVAAGLLLAAGFGMLAMVVVERTDGRVRSASGLAPFMAPPLLAAVAVGRNGRTGEVRLTPEEVTALLRRGRVDGERRSHLQLAAVGARSDAETLARALESGATEVGGPRALVPAVTVLPPVESHAVAEAAADRKAPVLLVLRAGGSEVRDVARVLERLQQAGATVAGGVLVCETEREARFAWR